MRHGRQRHKLSRDKAHRKALLRTMSKQLIEHERIETTLVKAKELRKYVEPFITLAKTDSLANRRLAVSRLGSKSAAAKLFNADFRKRFEGRPGGYTRILKMAHRLGDAADTALIEFVDYVLPEAPAEAAE